MCEVLRRAGYEPCPARDGVEALEVMEHYQCDLAVVDITMPRMDGITFTQTLRELSLIHICHTTRVNLAKPCYSDTPLTSFALDVYKRQVLRAGAVIRQLQLGDVVHAPMALLPAEPRCV